MLTMALIMAVAPLRQKKSIHLDQNMICMCSGFGQFWK